MSYTKASSLRYRFVRYTANALFADQPDSSQVYTYVHGRTKTGNYLPKWRQIIKSGGNATTTFSATIDELQADSCEMVCTFSWRSNPAYGRLYARRYRCSEATDYFALNPIVHFSILTGDFFAKARDRAIKSLYSEVWKAHHQLQGGVVLGELGKTARQLAGTASGLRKGVLNYLGKAVGIRRGKGSKESKRKAISNTYLEATYGWQPLIMDCKDLAKTIGRLCYESDRVRFRGYGQNAGQAANSVVGYAFSHLLYNTNTVDTAEVQVIYRGFIRGPKYEAGSPPAERIVSMSGFDLRSFVPTVWELIPYSFLVDYFTNIGDVLQALCTDTSGVYGLWKTEIWESRRDINIMPDIARTRSTVKQAYTNVGEYATDIVVAGKSGGYTIKHRDVSRVATGMPLMVPQFTGFDLPYRQFVNIGALFLSKTG